MPGTMGSLGGLAVYFLVKNSDILYGFTILFLFFLGILFAGEAEKIYKHKDARMIVIDEACGMLLALFFVPSNPLSIILGFFLFRIFDILKPPPARRLEKLTGSLGVMFDDILAAIYTNLILQIIFRVYYIIKI
jgi:phosphatidylglycerophosphatase A